MNSQGLCSCVHLCQIAENIPEDSCGRGLRPEHSIEQPGCPQAWVIRTWEQMLPECLKELNSHIKLGHRMVTWSLQEAQLRAQETLVCTGRSCHWMPSGGIRAPYRPVGVPALTGDGAEAPPISSDHITHLK